MISKSAVTNMVSATQEFWDRQLTNKETVELTTGKEPEHGLAERVALQDAPPPHR